MQGKSQAEDCARQSSAHTKPTKSDLVRMMTEKLDSFETVCEGWLTKSPPTTRILRARWRRRYFILRHSGELPGQYFLLYYTDRNCRKVKGQIDLDQCDQVDAGLRFENGKQKYQHMFTIRTPKRVYYLAAESEDDMNKWVDIVCHVCGLKAFLNDNTVTGEGDNISQATTRRLGEITPPTTPSTVITGPYIPISECISGKPLTSCTPPPSPGSESVFTDDDSIQRVSLPIKPTVNWETFPRPSDSSADDDAPLGYNSNQNVYTPTPQPSLYSYSNLPSPSHSTGGGGAGLYMPIPPAVNRELKPGRKCSDSTCSNEPSPTLPVYPPPNIDRNLKPAKHKKTLVEQVQVQVHTPSDHTQQATSTSTSSRSRDRPAKKKQEIQYLDLDHDAVDTVVSVNISGGGSSAKPSGPSTGLVKKSSENAHTPSTATVYKTVDFLKTEAFNRTRIEVEETRSRLCATESNL